MHWPKLSSDQIKKRVFEALNKNINYGKSPILGIPATYLDEEVFYDDAPFLENAPFLSTLIANPNHIGCHTLNNTEKLFQGTQELENEVIRICAEEIFGGEENAQDGYVSSGGTEANIEALWIYRNYFMTEYQCAAKEIGLIYSEDSHYSLSKGANLLNIHPLVIAVDKESREIDLSQLNERIDEAQKNGIRYFIVNMNMSTTMFGSVDDINRVTELLNKKKLIYKLHVDAAFGGFIYPFSNPGNPYTFRNPNISSFTIDGHKLLQTPYGTGIFLIRKDLIKYVRTKEAQYVPGTDHTLCGSRSGANAVSIWMILHTYGAEGWNTKIKKLLGSTSDMCSRLDDAGVRYFRNPFINIIAIHSGYISQALAGKYFLVADSYEEQPKWWKIVMMPHITKETNNAFMNDLERELRLKKQMI